jgi:hypothetical protein
VHYSKVSNSIIIFISNLLKEAIEKDKDHLSFKMWYIIVRVYIFDVFQEKKSLDICFEVETFSLENVFLYS